MVSVSYYIAISDLPGSLHPPPYCLINGRMSRKTLLNEKFVWIFSIILSEKFLMLRRIRRDIIKKVHGYSTGLYLRTGHRAANFQGRHIKKIEIEEWYAGKKNCLRERNLREIYTENTMFCLITISATVDR
jgi:hypothetical protein